MDRRYQRSLVAITLLSFMLFWTGASGIGQSGARTLLTLSVIDVGQGDSVLITTSDGYAMLVDGGPRSAADDVLKHLAESGVDQIDVLVCTHPHEDHIGGVAAVLDTVTIGRVIDSGVPAATKTYHGLHDKILEKALPLSSARSGDSLSIGPAAIRILWPSGPMADGLNNCSVVARVAYGGFSALLTGDIEAAAEYALIAACWLSPTVVLKVAHHGSRTSSTAEFLDALAPEIAIISVGARNRYGHPNAETVARLEAHGANVYRTDLNGTVTVRTDGSVWGVHAERDSARRTTTPGPDGPEEEPQAYCIFRFKSSSHSD